jgi:hypothetical protein
VPRAAEIFPVFLRFVLPFIVIINSKAPKRSGYYLIILAAYLGSIFGHDWSKSWRGSILGHSQTSPVAIATIRLLTIR